MSYCRQFAQFDPHSGVVPRIPYGALSEIAERARHLLQDATTAQIIELAESIEWMIDRAVQHKAKEAEAADEPVIKRFERSDGQWLKECAFYYDIVPKSGERFPYHHQAFAVLALWLVADANFSIQPELDKIGNHRAVVPETADIAHQWTVAGRYAIDAMEAVCMAEELSSRHAEARLVRTLFPNEDGGIESAVKKRISLQAKAAAIEKHKANRAARLRTLELYATHNYPSVEAASQAISKLVHKAPRTVAKWLYDERNGRTPPVTDLQK
jgi:tRNA U34 5-methylaminomethyl-2-thiouridine-forming methyltransferase MnmC